MRNGFSDATKIYIAEQDVLIEAEQRFRREWADILTQVRKRLSRGGWAFRTDTEPPYEELKIRRPNWPDGIRGAHYEVSAQERFRRQSIAEIALHIEQDVPRHEDVCKRIRELIKPHSSRIMELLADCAPSLPEAPPQKVLLGELALADITSEAICRIFENMAQIESFVDEAILLAGKETIWRTEFRADRNEEIWTNWFGSEGGQSFELSNGRFTSGAMRIDGTKTNARREYKEEGNYSVLLHPTYGIANGQDIYVCAMVKTSVGGMIRLQADGHRKTSEGNDAFLLSAFNLECRVEASNKWQSVFLKARVLAENNLNYDYTKEGAWVVMNVVTEDTEFLVDSIEIGRCK